MKLIGMHGSVYVEKDFLDAVIEDANKTLMMHHGGIKEATNLEKLAFMFLVESGIINYEIKI